MANAFTDFRDNQLAPSIQRVKEYLVSTGVEKTGIVGFCWGAKVYLFTTENTLSHIL
jgi:dienelactone hydrolase